MKISILGAGESGVGAAILAQKRGEEVWISDAGKIKESYRHQLSEYNIPFEEGQHTKQKFFESDIVIKSPGIPETASIVQELRGADKYIISEVEYAFQCTTAKIIAITGSNGKTTTTALTYELLKSQGLNVEVGGNIGQSFALLVATKPSDYYVIELSSFQLDDIDKFCPHMAVLLNITADHLDRYAYDMSKYAAAKLKIGENQSINDLLIYNLDDPVSNEEMSKYNLRATRKSFSREALPQAEAWLEGNEMVVSEFGRFSQEDMQLMGKHNALNAMAALLIVKSLGLSATETLRSALNSFEAIEHRLEKVAVVDGVTYINDSKATNVESVYYALESMTKPTIWIVGGIDKGNDYTVLETFVREKVKSIIVLGKNSEKFFQHFGYKPFSQGMTTTEVINLATEQAEPGDCVLLSPACSSFDLFQNYAQRGRIFKEEVAKLRRVD